MFTGSETRARHKFLERSIADAYNFFADDPHAQNRLGPVAELLAQVTREMFIPNVRHGVASIPRQYLSGGTPVIAGAPDETIQLSPDFARFYPIQRYAMAKKLEAWGYKGNVPQFIDEMERDIVGAALQNPLVLQLGDRFRNDPNEKGAAAFTLCSASARNFNPTYFRNFGKNPLKKVISRPTVFFPYRGKDSVVTPATFAHEEWHVLEMEGEPLRTYQTDPAKSKKAAFSEELKAYHTGALTVLAMLDGGVEESDLHHHDALQVGIESERIRAFREDPRRDPFTPLGALEKRLAEVGLDIVSRETRH